MHERDAANWAEIAARRRPATWSDFVGSVDGATYLSDAGRELLPRMIGGFASWFGDAWIAQALDLDNAGRIGPLIGFSPAMAILGGEHGVAGVFIELVRWWASIESQRAASGIAQVQVDQRQDVTLPRLLHGRTQLRLGAIATESGLDAIYEPTPGDLFITDPTDPARSITIEITTMTAPRGLVEQTAATDYMFELIRGLEREHAVWFHGDLPKLIGDTEPWAKRISEAATESGRLGMALSVQWNGKELLVEPGDVPDGATLNGPEINIDTGSRVRSTASRKAAQVRAAEASWLWIENHGAIDHLVPISSLELRDQVDAIRVLLDGALDEVPSAKGITFSGAGRRQGGPLPPSHERRGSCEAFRYPLPLDRVRTTFNIARIREPHADIVRQLVEREPYWLNSTLSRLGVAQDCLELVRPDLRQY